MYESLSSRVCVYLYACGLDIGDLINLSFHISLWIY